MTKNKIVLGILAASVLAIVGLATTTYAGSRSGHFGLGHMGTNWVEKFSNLGINSDQLKADIDTGQSFEEALANQDINQEDLLAQKKEHMKEKLNDLVTAGDLTQEEANQLLEMKKNHTFNKDGSKFHRQGFKHHNKNNWHDFIK